MVLLLVFFLAWLTRFGSWKVVGWLVHLVQQFFEFLDLLLQSLFVAGLGLLEVLRDVGVVVMGQASVQSLDLTGTFDPLV